MPVYEYYCEANHTSVEVEHSIMEKLKTWGELCDYAGIDPGDTPSQAPLERLLFPAGVNTPAGDSHLKNIGFTKLVKRDDGVYENVTRTGDEARYMKRGDSSTLPHLNKKISD